MEKKEDLIKDFKVAIASTVKSVSNINDLEVVFGSQNLESFFPSFDASKYAKRLIPYQGV